MSEMQEPEIREKPEIREEPEILRLDEYACFFYSTDSGIPGQASMSMHVAQDLRLIFWNQYKEPLIQ